jgi:hypothetical protein
MATHNTITSVPFSFEVLDAGIGTNTLSDLVTAKWQPIVQVNTGGIDMRVDGLTVEFTSTTDSETVEFGTVTLNSDDPAPDYRGAAALFPDLDYSVGVEELTAVTISGSFTYLRGSTSPVNGTTAVTAGVRYNKTGTVVAGLLSLGGGNDPSGTSSDVSTFNGANNTCTVGRKAKAVRFGPQKIKFHRSFAGVTAKCQSALDAPK